MRVTPQQKTETPSNILAAPAYKLYTPMRTLRILGFVVTTMLVRTHTTRINWLESVRDTRYLLFNRSWFLKYPGCLILPGIYITAWLQYIPAFLITLVFLMIYIPLSILWLLLIFVSITLLSTYHTLSTRVMHVALHCPSCYLPLEHGPVYLCSGCKAEHTTLHPSSYGVFAHRCKTCQTRLPTLDRLGRKQLERICPSCRCALHPTLGTGIPMHIPLIGGPSAGKTYVLTSALTAIKSLSHTSITFLDPLQEQTITTQWHHIVEGEEITPTEALTPPALIISVKRVIQRHVYFYDPSGAAFLTSERTRQQAYYAHSSGFILLVDPTTIPAFYHRHQHEELPGKTQKMPPPGHASFPYIYERFLQTFEAFTRLSTRQRYRQPVAVVVTKVDSLHLENSIGRPAVRQLIARGKEPGGTSEAEATHKVVRAFLCDYELENVVRDLEAHFTHVRYFSSASPDNLASIATQKDRARQQVVLAEPVTWLFKVLEVSS